MIRKVVVQNFKQFKDRTEFNLESLGITFLAGGNNCGKSTLLQALAVWEFARTVLEVAKGPISLTPSFSGSGVGVSAEEFTPIAVPDFKYLFTDLRTSSGQAGDGTPLRIRCEWDLNGQVRYLEFGFSHSNDRLFLKTVESNLTIGEKIPRLAYLPPFAGIGSREERMIPSVRKRWIGKGLAGAVMRNLLYDYWAQNQRSRDAAKLPNGRIRKSDLATIRRTDSWEQLSQVLEEVFKAGLSARSFNEQYHTTIDVYAWKGVLVKAKFKRNTLFPQKDLMVEGSGFLQWLSVYALALNTDLDTLLLDEPDSHLHPALQGHLIHKLGQLARLNSKQVLLATHSTTILGETPISRVFRMEERGYLTDENGRVRLFVGLGSQYAPRLDQLKRFKRLFLHDGPSDLIILMAWAKTLGITWPDSLVCWAYKKEQEAREILVAELRAEIPGLKTLSLEDRDNKQHFNEIPKTLAYAGRDKGGLMLRMWRRRNIENYLLCVAAIARASGRSEDDVRSLLSDPHCVSISSDFTSSDCVQTLANIDGKEIVTKHARSITNELGITYKEISEAMRPDEIPEDGKTLLQLIVDLCKP